MTCVRRLIPSARTGHETAAPEVGTISANTSAAGRATSAGPNACRNISTPSRRLTSGFEKRDPGETLHLRPMREQGSLLALDEGRHIEHEVGARFERGVGPPHHLPRSHRQRPEQSGRGVGRAKFREPPAIPGRRNRIGRESADGHVIGMQVRSVRIERDDDLRPDDADGFNNLPANRVRRCEGQPPVRVSEYTHGADPEFRAGRHQLRLAHGAEPLAWADRRFPELAVLARRRGAQGHTAAFRDRPARKARREHGFVVRMGKYEEQASLRQAGSSCIRASLPRAALGARGWALGASQPANRSHSSRRDAAKPRTRQWPRPPSAPRLAPSV